MVSVSIFLYLENPILQRVHEHHLDTPLSFSADRSVLLLWCKSIVITKILLNGCSGWCIFINGTQKTSVGGTLTPWPFAYNNFQFALANCPLRAMWIDTGWKCWLDWTYCWTNLGAPVVGLNVGEFSIIPLRGICSSTSSILFTSTSTTRSLLLTFSINLFRSCKRVGGR